MKKQILLITLVMICLTGFSQRQSAALKEWHDNKYSMFIHFGIYSELGGVWEGKPVTRGYSEQIQAHAGIYTDVYDDVPTRFNPAKWDADEIASLARKAGMRSIVITSKHHDGFCMFHTATTRFNVVDASPFKRDIIKELSDACKKSRLRFGLYFSLIDYRLHPWANTNANPITADHHEYNKKQITELLSNYGPISEMWFDMGSLTVRQSQEIYELVHRLQPDCMVSGRLGNDAYDFCVMGDNEYPDYKIDAPWQTPASIFNETWGYRSWQKRENVEGKTREKLLSLLKVVSRGGNYLLNIGPKGDGTVVPYEAEVLTGVGKWLEKNGEAVYGTKGNPLAETYPWGEITSRENTLYLILSGQKVNELSLSGITGKIRKASLLNDPAQAFHTTFSGGKLRIIVPAAAFPEKEIQVLKLEFASPYQLAPENLLTGKSISLDFQNAIKHYSYSCIDYYNNHRSVVKQSWNFSINQKNRAPEIYYTREESGREILLTWNGQEELVKLNGGTAMSLGAVQETAKWGNRYAYGPVNSSFEGLPGKISAVINPETDWAKSGGRKWSLVSEWQNAKEETMVSKPIQQCYILQEITSDKDQYQLVEICSGDGVQVWLNGENLVRHNNPRGSRMNMETVLLPLKTGKNQLLVKFYNRYGYKIEYSISNQISQTIYAQKLGKRNFSGVNNCELKPANPGSPHQPIRMNNIRIAL